MRLGPVLLLAIGACRFDPGKGPAVTNDASVPGDGDVDGMPGDANVVPADAAISELVIALAANSDDALQDPPPGATLINYSWMSLYTANHWGGMRFVVPTVAHGAKIVDAYLDVYVDTSANEDDPNVAITTEANPSPATFMAVNNNISSRPRSAMTVAWVAANIGSGVRRSPSLVPLLQERIDSLLWAPGQAIAFIFDVQGPSFEVRQRDHAPTGMYGSTLTIRFINP
jgi:hypothetical protein